MAKVYANLINAGAVNAKTGEPWKLEDVPDRWRKATEKLLEAEAD